MCIRCMLKRIAKPVIEDDTVKVDTVHTTDYDGILSFSLDFSCSAGKTWKEWKLMKR